MARLELHIVRAETPELVQTVFEDSAIGTAHACRGTRAALSFPWSRGVRAATLLLLGVRCFGPAHSIRGSAGSDAAALDYAVGREARWIQEMFGCTADGRAYARRLFVRDNPERKRPGPVSITINARLLPPDAVVIYVDGVEASPPDLPSLYKQVASGILETERNLLPSATEPSADVWQLAPYYQREILAVLKHREIFGISRYRERQRRILQNPSFQTVAGPVSHIVSAEDEALAARKLLPVTLGPLDDYASNAGRLFSIGCTPSHTAIVALVSHLRRVRGAAIEINYCFPHSSAIVDKMLDGTGQLPDACVLSTASFAALVGSGRRPPYDPVMLLPSATHAILRPQSSTVSRKRVSKGKREAEHFLLLSDIPSTPRFMFDELRAAGQISARALVSHATPVEAASALASRDPSLRAALWFPHVPLNTLFNTCEVVPLGASPSTYPSNILMIRADLGRNRPLVSHVCALLRTAWRELATSESTVSGAVNSLLADPLYVRTMFRFSGLDGMGSAGSVGSADD